MKKFVLSLVLLGFLGAASTTGYLFWQNGNWEFLISPFASDTTEEVEVATDEEILTGEALDNDITALLDEMSLVEEQSNQTNTRLPISPNFNSVKLFENPFIRFSHPAYVRFKSETLNFIEISDEEGTLLGTINIYSNPENLSLEDFSKKENLVDYFASSIVPVEVNIPTAVRALKFTDYPELQTADVFLIEFQQLIVIGKDFSTDKVVGEYLLKSIEKSQ